MAVKTLQITQTGSAVQLATASIFARWVIFQNTAAAAMRLGDANVTTGKGVSLAATGIPWILPPMPDGAHYDLSQWYAIGTNTQLLDVVYDSMN